MTSWRRWLRLGLLSTILVAVLAFVVGSGWVERDIAGRVAGRLAAEGQTWASVAVIGRDATITGTAPSTESEAAAIAVAQTVDGVRNVKDATDLLPSASPYVWSARRAGRVLTVLGDVPSESMRNSVLAEARRALPDAEIHDEMRLARGASTAFNAATGFALAQLADLSEGTVTLTDETLALSGVAASSTAYAAAHTALQSGPPSAVVLGPVDILPARADPFVWSANFDGKQLVLAGFVPNDVVHETLVAAAKATLSRVPVVDNTNIASGEPDGFAEAASFAISTLGRMNQGGVTLDGLNLDIAGVARTVDDYEAILDGLGNDLPPGVKVVSNAIEPAAVSPYGWKATKNAGGVTLTGYVPSPAMRDDMMTAAKAFFGTSAVADRVRIASGEPKMDWLGAIRFALLELSKLGEGSVALGDHSFDIAGEAATPDAFSDLLAANDHTLPAGLQLASADIHPPSISPYRFVATASGGTVTLEGYAPSTADRQAIVDLANRKFAGGQVVNKLAYAGGAPAGFTDAVKVGFQAMTRLAGGHVEIVDDKIAVKGLAYDEAAAPEIAGAVQDGAPAGFSATADVSTRQDDQPVDAVRCRDLIEAVVARGSIQFDGNRPEIGTDSYGLLDQVAATLARCPDARIEVGAHSDAQGSAARNRDLSQSRAEAVVDYLVDAGVKRERLTAVSYAAAKAGAAAKTPARRIEFTVAIPDGG